MTGPGLTGRDRRIIAQARELAAARTADGLRAHLADRGLLEPGEDAAIYPFALGVAGNLLAELAAIVERLGGDSTAAAEDTRRLAEIRGVLGRFDWEHDDRQLCLEAIERITDGGQP